MTKLLILLVFASLAAADDNDVGDLVTWINSVGGAVDPRQVIRRDEPNDPSSLRGVYATANIGKGTALLDIPISATITSNAEKGDPPNMCGTILSLKREIELGDKSSFYPYVHIMDYHPFIPDTYSKAGQLLLQNIFGDIMDNVRQYQIGRHLRWFSTGCGGDIENDPVFVQAGLLSVARGLSYPFTEGSNLLVPYYDMYNHINGRRLNTLIQVDQERLKVIASKDIKPGEQIYNSYGTGTLSHLTHYGFVEQPPQRWMFVIPEIEGVGQHVIGFDLHEDEAGNVVIQWMIDNIPNAEDIMFLRTSELKRLEVLYDEILNDIESLPIEEKSVILQFYNAFLLAIKSAVASREAVPTRNEEL